MASPKVFGTYIHGVLDNKAVFDYVLSPYRDLKSDADFDAHEYKERQYDALADLLRYIDIEKLYKILRRND